MKLIETSDDLYSISKLLYLALASQKPETVLSLKFENGSEQLQVSLWDDDEVQVFDGYLVRKSTMNDYEMVEIEMYTHIEILTLEG